MGRGLSKQQKAILRMAYDNSDHRGGHADVYTFELLYMLYGFEYDSPPFAHDYFSENSFSQNHFRLTSGEDKILMERAHASLSRSIRRLVRRRLAQRIEHDWYGHTGLNLTHLGRERALAIDPRVVATVSLTDRPVKNSKLVQYLEAHDISLKSARQASFVVQVMDALTELDDPVGSALANELGQRLNRSITAGYHFAFTALNLVRDLPDQTENRSGQ